jgi:hypothetical protein
VLLEQTLVVRDAVFAVDETKQINYSLDRYSRHIFLCAELVCRAFRPQSTHPTRNENDRENTLAGALVH